LDNILPQNGNVQYRRYLPLYPGALADKNAVFDGFIPNKMDLQNILRQLGGAGGGGAGGGVEAVVQDTSETVVISSLALLKMLKHGIVVFSPD
jgi:hypothetical protein